MNIFLLQDNWHSQSLRPHKALGTGEASSGDASSVWGISKASVQTAPATGAPNSCTGFTLILTELQNLPSDMLARLAEIMYYMQMRQYQKANDSYLRLSIGSAPWPIGVTMVG